MTNTKYNGWTNYETWKTHLEVLDGHEWEDADTLKEIVTDVMLDGVENSTAQDAILVFIEQVNFEEISYALSDKDYGFIENEGRDWL